VVAAHLTRAEWDELGRRMHASMPRDRMVKLFGMMLEDASAEERKQMMSALPLAVRLMWRLIGHRKYRQLVRSVRRPGS